MSFLYEFDSWVLSTVLKRRAACGSGCIFGVAEALELSIVGGDEGLVCVVEEGPEGSISLVADLVIIEENHHDD
ncbi:hypothetical protein [Rhizobium sp.]|uniref:hypothetical protein n=1 Tax=Rhizobium sp. TaxID=391 RepID=UPI002F201009